MIIIKINYASVLPNVNITYDQTNVYAKVVYGQVSSGGGSGTVTSVGLSMPSAFSVANSPITLSGTLAVTGAGNTAQYIRGDGSLATLPTITTADKLIIEVYNNSGATITKGTVIYINGSLGNLPTIAKGLASLDSTSAQTLGLVQSDITNMNNGYVIITGKLSDLDTQSYPDGTQLYLSGTTAGAYTSIKQYAPIHLVYVGIVTRSHPTQGIIEVKIQNGYELDELHDVAAQTPSNNDSLFYETSSNLWKNKSISTVLGYSPEQPLTFSSPLSRVTNAISIPSATSIANGYLSSTDWTTFNSKQNEITLTTTGTSGAATFSSGTLNIPQYATGNGYVLQACVIPTANFTWADATIYYLGSGHTLALSTTQGIGELYIPKAGTIKTASVLANFSTAGSAEAWSMSILINGTTATTIQSITTSAIQRIWSNTSLNISVAQGDFVEIRSNAVTWATNPVSNTGNGMNAIIYIE